MGNGYCNDRLQVPTCQSDLFIYIYLTISLRVHEAERSNCFSKNPVIAPINDENMLKFAENEIFLAGFSIA